MNMLKVGFISWRKQHCKVWRAHSMTWWWVGLWHVGVPSARGQHLNVCFVTYIVNPEVSAGPVVPLFLWDHLHGDVSVSYGLFRERPVMVAFHLRGQWHNLSRQTGDGRKSQCSLGKNGSPCLWRPCRTIARMKNGASGSLWYTESTQAMATASMGCAVPVGTPSQALTLLFSLHCVSMTMIWDFCCRTIFQKSFLVSGSGPCVAIYSWGELYPWRMKWQSCHLRDHSQHQMLLHTKEENLRIYWGSAWQRITQPGSCSLPFSSKRWSE